MKVLIISHAYTPTISPRSFRWGSIAEYWADKNHHIDVITVWRLGLAKEEKLNNVNVYRVGIPAAELLRDRLSEKAALPAAWGNGSDELKSSGAGKSFAAQVFAKLKWIHGHTWKKVWWPDSSCLWYFPAIRKAKHLLMQKQHDALITVSLPFTDHLVGLGVKKRFPELRWVVDVGDPFCFVDKPQPNNQRIYRKLNQAYDEKVFDNSEAITVTNNETAEIYKNLFPKQRGKIFVVPHLLETLKNIETANPIFANNRKIRIVYIGRLYGDHRKPDFLLKLFSRLLESEFADKLELHFFGSIYNCEELFQSYKRFYNKEIYLHGSVSHQKALRVMKEADILVNYGHATSYQLPCKVIEYVGTGRPIINIARNPRDPSKAFFKDYPLCLTLFEGEGEVLPHQVNDVVELIRSCKSAGVEDVEHFLAPYRLERISQSYEDLINSEAALA